MLRPRRLLRQRSKSFGTDFILPLGSWTSPTGNRGLLDYVAVPSSWDAAFDTLDTPCLDDMHSGLDHDPVLVHCRPILHGAKPPSKVRPNWKALDTPEGSAALRHAWVTAPVVGWDVDATSHVARLHDHLYQSLARDLPDTTTTPRNPALSAATLDIIKYRRHIRRCERSSRRQFLRETLWFCLRSWRAIVCKTPLPLTEGVRRSGRVCRRWFGVLQVAHQCVSKATSRDRRLFQADGTPTSGCRAGSVCLSHSLSHKTREEVQAPSCSSAGFHPPKAKPLDAVSFRTLWDDISPRLKWRRKSTSPMCLPASTTGGLLLAHSRPIDFPVLLHLPQALPNSRATRRLVFLASFRRSFAGNLCWPPSLTSPLPLRPSGEVTFPLNGPAVSLLLFLSPVRLRGGWQGVSENNASEASLSRMQRTGGCTIRRPSGPFFDTPQLSLAGTFPVAQCRASVRRCSFYRCQDRILFCAA